MIKNIEVLIFSILIFITHNGLTQDLRQLFEEASKSSDLEGVERIKSLAAQNDDKQLLADAYYKSGYFRAEEDQLFEAVDDYQEAVRIYQIVGDNVGLSKVLTSLGVIYYSAGFDQIALDYYNDALRIQELLNDTTGLIISYYNTGQLYKNRDGLDSAKVYYEKAVDLAIKKRSNLLGRVYNDLGILYKKMSDYKTSLRYYDLADENDTSLIMKARTLNNRGNLYYDQGDESTARKYFRETVQLDSNRISKRTLSIVYSNLGKMQTDLDSALYFHEKSFSYLKDKSLVVELASMYYTLLKRLEDLHREKGHNKESIYYDSLQDGFNENLIDLYGKLRSSFLQYQVQAANWKMQSELNKKNQILLYTIIILLFSVSALIIFFLLYQKGRRREKDIVKKARKVYEILKA